MTGDDFRTVRALYGESQLEFGLRVGFEGPHESIRRRVRRYESGETPVVGPLAALLAILREVPVERRRASVATKGKA